MGFASRGGKGPINGPCWPNNPVPSVRLPQSTGQSRAGAASPIAHLRSRCAGSTSSLLRLSVSALQKKAFSLSLSLRQTERTSPVRGAAYAPASAQPSRRPRILPPLRHRGRLLFEHVDAFPTVTAAIKGDSPRPQSPMSLSVSLIFFDFLFL